MGNNIKIDIRKMDSENITWTELGEGCGFGISDVEPEGSVATWLIS
jgi:hypothetical protein